MDNNYNSFLYTKYNIDFNNYMNNNYNIIHKSLYNDALEEFESDLPYTKVTYKYKSANGLSNMEIEHYKDKKLFTVSRTLIIKTKINSFTFKLLSSESLYQKLSFIDSNEKIVFDEFIAALLSLDQDFSSISISSTNEYTISYSINKLAKNIIKIEEIPNNNYILPSKILIWTKDDNDIIYKARIDLTNYWNNDYIKSIINTDKKIKYDQYTVLTGKIIKYDYLNKRAFIYSRYTDKTVILPFNQLDDTIEVDEDFCLDDTFTKKYLDK